MLTCQLCGLERPLIKAHIIPRKLYIPIREASQNENPGDQVPRMYVVDKKSEQSQSGIHDSSILCKECDGSKVIGSWDKYGQAFLLDHLESEKYIDDSTGKSGIYKVDSFDYKKLKLFFISILWRAAVTKHNFFDQVKPGSWEPRLRKMIQTQEPGDESDFSVILFRYTGNFSEIVCHPTKRRQDGVDFYRFRVPNYGFLVKVNQRNFSSDFSPFILSPNQPFLVRVTEYKNSKEYDQLLNVRGKMLD